MLDIHKRTCRQKSLSTLFNTVHDMTHDAFHSADIDFVALLRSNAGFLFLRPKSLSKSRLRFEVFKF